VSVVVVVVVEVVNTGVVALGLVAVVAVVVFAGFFVCVVKAGCGVSLRANSGVVETVVATRGMMKLDASFVDGVVDLVVLSASVIVKGLVSRISGVSAVTCPLPRGIHVGGAVHCPSSRHLI